ncbi:hypothetical protein V1264_000120 [Littorina saxatilis]|uniref:Uncharacterized protein n=1 Tax=Littorina saxatilis TaxID=31220 RepID=A0AAN9C3Y5_9CAEN
MPVLMENSNSTQFRTSERDVDSLVEEVRERLCLKSRDKLNAARRSMPYSCGSTRRKGSAFVLSPEKCDSSASHRSVERERGKRVCNSCLMKCTRCKCSNSLDIRESRNLLKTLLAEHRLIQEAVRRIHGLHHQYGDTTSASVEAPSSCSVRSSSADSMDSSTFSSTVSVDL